MTTLAITGHMDLTDSSTNLVHDALRETLKPYANRLTVSADEVLVLPHETADRSAYEDANRTLLQRADRLVAVWNGEPPSGKGGGTADTVLEARAAGLPVEVVWPQGATRRG